MKGDIVLDKNTGLVFRDGKILGRKNWIVEVESSLTAVDEFNVKAYNKEEAEEKGMAIAKNKYLTYGDDVYSEVAISWCPQE